MILRIVTREKSNVIFLNSLYLFVDIETIENVYGLNNKITIHLQEGAKFIAIGNIFMKQQTTKRQ